MKELKVYIILGVLLLLAIGYGVYQHDKIGKLETKLAITEQNLLASKDTLKRYATENGELAKKMAFLETDFSKEKTRLEGILKQKNLKIITQQTIIARLDSIINAGTGVVTYIDSSKVRYTRKDTTSLYKFIMVVYINPVTKKGYDTLRVWMDPIKLVPVIYQDADGKLYGSIESLTPGIKFESLETKINSDWIPPKDKPLYSSIWERIGLYGGVNINGFDSFEGGIVLRPFTLGYQRFIDRTGYIKIGINATFNEIFKGIF